MENYIVTIRHKSTLATFGFVTETVGLGILFNFREHVTAITITLGPLVACFAIEKWGK